MQQSFSGVGVLSPNISAALSMARARHKIKGEPMGTIYRVAVSSSFDQTISATERAGFAARDLKSWIQAAL